MIYRCSQCAAALDVNAGEIILQAAGNEAGGLFRFVVCGNCGKSQKFRAEAMTAKSPPKEDVIVGESVSNEEIFYATWGDQLIKDSLNVLNQSIRQFVTLSAALLAGSVAFYDKQIVHPFVAMLSMLLLFGSLAVSVYGVIPLGRPVGRGEFDKIASLVNEMVYAKRRLLIAAAILLLAAVALMMCGVLFSKYPR